MQVHITFKKFDSSEALKAHANEKSEKLQRFLPSEAKIDWVLHLDGDMHVADLKIHGPHVDLFAQANSENMYTSIDAVCDKLEKQLVKQKEMLKDHLHRKH